MNSRGHICVDLDGTLAEYDHWRGIEHIGEPIMEMVDRVKGWLADGHKVKLFTARWSVFKQRPQFKEVWDAWSLKYIGQVIPVTCTKDLSCKEIWDDKAIRVVNGGPCCEI